MLASFRTPEEAALRKCVSMPLESRARICILDKGFEYRKNKNKTKHPNTSSKNMWL